MEYVTVSNRSSGRIAYFRRLRTKMTREAEGIVQYQGVVSCPIYGQIPFNLRVQREQIEDSKIVEAEIEGFYRLMIQGKATDALFSWNQADSGIVFGRLYDSPVQNRYGFTGPAGLAGIDFIADTEGLPPTANPGAGVVVITITALCLIAIVHGDESCMNTASESCGSNGVKQFTFEWSVLQGCSSTCSWECHPPPE